MGDRKGSVVTRRGEAVETILKKREGGSRRRLVCVTY